MSNVINHYLLRDLALTLAIVLILANVSNAQRGYYDAPYTRYEADLGNLTNASVTPRSYNQADLQSEASDQVCVDMSNSGAEVEWTVITAGDGLVVRYSVPDGESGSIDVYANGVYAGTLNLSTYYSWEYLCCNGNPNNGAVINTNPKMRFDEVRMRLPSVLPAGGTLRLVRTSGNIHLDFAELELVPVQVNATGGDIVYSGNGNDLQTFVYNNRGNTIYIPPGYYEINEELYFGEDNTTLKGAGSWYTQIHFTGNGSGDGGIRANAWNINISGLFLTTVRNSRSNSYKAINGVFTPGTYITDVWAEHFEAGVWLGQYNSGSIGNVDGLTVSYCRFRNNYADGINFCKGTLNSVCEHTNFRNNGDDDMAIWSANNQECRNNTYRYNTSENCWRASGCAIYGGYSNVAHHLVIKDNLEVGLRVNNEFPGAPFNTGGMHEFYEITLINCGTNNDLFHRPVGAIDLFCRNAAGNQVRNVRFADIDIIDSKNDAILINRFSGDGFYNLVFENIAIDGTGVEYPYNDAEGAGGQRGYGIKITGDPAGYGTYCNITYANQGGNASGWENYNGIGSFSWTQAGGCSSTSVSITSPAYGSNFGTCETITITANANASSGSINNVEFFVDGVSIGQDFSAPYSIDWTNTTPGAHTITAVATNSSSATATSSAIDIFVAPSISETGTAPTVDGVVEALWGNHDANSLDLVSQGSTGGGSDLEATFKTTYDNTYLYVLVEVTDESLMDDGTASWEDDAVEVFIDIGNDKLNSYGSDDYAYIFIINDPTVYEAGNSVAGVQYEQSITGSGYVMEFAFPWSTLGVPLIDGSYIGIDVHVNDDDDGGTRDTKIAWADGTDNAWQNPSLFGTLQATGIQTETAFVCSGSSYTFPDGTTQNNITSQVVYTSNLTSSQGCDSIIETTVDVITAYNVSESAEVCSGGSYTFPDGTTQNNITSQVVYTSNLTSSQGCDSIIETTVDVITAYNVSESAEVCSGGSYTFPDGTTQNNITSQVIYTSNLTSSQGCDSIIETTVDVITAYNVSESAEVCSGGSYTFPDGTTQNNITSQVIYTSNLTSSQGCDSIIETTVDVITVYNVSESAEVCSGGSYTFPDGTTQNNITSQVVYSSNLTSSQGCDSIIETTVDVITAYNVSESAEVCSGASYTFPDGTTQTNITSQVVYSSNLTSSQGCDSIIETTVDVITAYNVSESAEVCSGGSYTFPDGTIQNNITSQVVYTSNLTSSQGCDSIIETTVDVITAYNVSESAEVCSGASYTFPDGTTQTNITSQVVYSSNLTSSQGCDSIIETTVDVITAYNVSESAEVCSGGSYTFPDGTIQNNITSQVVYTSNLTSSQGCDSIIETTVDVITAYNVSESAEVCSGASYTFPDGTTQNNITSQVIYTSNLTSSQGCDSIIETTVDVITAYNVSESAEVCSGGSYTFPDGTTQNNITSQVVYTSNLTSSQGCDSIIETTVDVITAYNVSESAEVCSGGSYTFPDGTTQNNITSQVVYTSNLTSSQGCDSIIETTVDVTCGLDADFSVDKTETCKGVTIVFTNQTTGASTGASYVWDFGEGASPAMATGIGPHAVVYTTEGFKDVSLTVDDGTTDTETQPSVIEIIADPNSLPEISGPAWLECNATGQVYTVSGSPGSNFNWNSAGGATIVSGQGTTSITVDFANQSGTITVTEQLTNGCVMPSDDYFVNVCATNITGAFERAEIQVYPNPFYDFTTVVLESEEDLSFEIQVTTLDGRFIYSGSYLSGEEVVIGEGFSSGMYICHIVSENQFRSFKLIKN